MPTIRRVQLLAVGVPALLVLGSIVAVAQDAAEGPRNLLIIQTDEHHFGTLGCYGGKIVETPHIDWLAENGARCTSFYATTPVCSPSRSSFVSGQYPYHTPVISNNIPMNDDIVTFAEVLRRKGYATGYAGKWHLDGSGKPQWAPKRQFGFADNRFMFNRGHWKKMEDTPDGPRVAARDRRGQPSYSVEGADEKSFTTDWLADKAVRFIKEHGDEPFCYMVSFPDPHGPNTVRAPYDTMYANVKVPIPRSLRKTPEQTPKWGKPDKSVNEQTLAKIMPPYFGMVKCIDDNVGKMLNALRAQNLLDKTIVVFTADHGDLCGEHGRLNKGVPYEGSAKIPFVLYAPKMVKPGTVIDQALGCVDFFPTILSLLDVPYDGRVEGRDASPLFVGQAATWEDIAFMRSTGKTGWLCAVTDDYKLVYSVSDDPWLFDLSKNPDELQNRFQDPSYRAVVRELTAKLDQYVKQHHDPFGELPEIRSAMDRVMR